MSLFPATVPQGTLLYHGDCSESPPDHVDWLAFEIPHAELFTFLCLPSSSHDDHSQQQQHLAAWELQMSGGGGYGGPITPPPGSFRRGYLQIYQTTRPLKLLYIDGMGAAKSDFGPMDTQDVLLLNDPTRLAWDDFNRAKQLCTLASKWHIDGFIRMEAGFEIIKCDFSTGVELLSARRRPYANSSESIGALSLFEYIRDVSARYDGIGASRVRLDYSSMVSAYFYPANLSNPDRDSDLPRLVSSAPEHLSRMLSDLDGLIARADPEGSVNWQGVVDMIVKEYSGRLQYMLTDPPAFEFLAIINTLLNVYIDYDDPTEHPIEICSRHYLLPIHSSSSTSQDQLIHAALSTVTHKICTALFSAREILLKEEPQPELHTSSAAVDLIRSLVAWLDWPEWKFCGRCAVDEVCFVAVFPFGTAEDHFYPSCKNRTELENQDLTSNYWFGNGRREKPGRGDT